jgi:hypothetical protein
MAETFYLAVGDTARPIECTLAYADGTVPDLTGATVRFRATPGGTTTPTLDALATILNGPTADVRYDFAPADVASGRRGTYRLAWQVTFPDGKQATFPTGRSEYHMYLIID